MKTLFIPDSSEAARREMRMATSGALKDLPKNEFLRVWCSLFYLNPGLHPDFITEAGEGWSGRLKSIGLDACRRFESGEILDDEFYPVDAQWAGLYDQIKSVTEEERVHRLHLTKRSVK